MAVARRGATVDLGAMTQRTAGAFIFGAFVSGWAARAMFKWILDLPGTWTTVLIIAAAVGGGLVCAVGEIEERRKALRSPQEGAGTISRPARSDGDLRTP
jgi:hypothetical protein